MPTYRMDYSHFFKIWKPNECIFDAPNNVGSPVLVILDIEFGILKLKANKAPLVCLKAFFINLLN